MLSGLAPARRRLVIGVGALVGVLVVAGLVAVVVPRLGGTDAADQATPGPVVLVPGYGGDVSDLDPLVARVRKDGRTAVVFTPTNGGTGDLKAQADRLAALVDATLTKENADSVDLVGYSAGGVIARLYVRDDGGASKVRRVLTIGSPHHGTDVATLAEETVGSCPTACEQLATDSDLIRELNAGDETPEGPLWLTVRSSSDQVVTPTDSAELQGATSNVLIQQLCPKATTSHGDLPGDAVTIGLLDSMIRAKQPGQLAFTC